MTNITDVINTSTPLYPPFGRLAVVAGLFVLAWMLARVAGRVAAVLVDRSERHGERDGGQLDTGVIASLKQRETAISLATTTIRYTVFAIALMLSILTLVGARRIETVVGASFVAIVLAFAAQRFLLDLLSGLLMFFERWFRVGDTIVVEPWNLQGVVEEVSLRSIRLRGVNGDVMRVPNSEVKATRVVPHGVRQFDIELYASAEVEGADLVERLARIVPAGPTHFVRHPELVETERLDDDLYRIRATAAVAPGREWLAEELLPELTKERAGDEVLVHGPVVTPVDELAARRYARLARTNADEGGRRRLPFPRRTPVRS